MVPMQEQWFRYLDKLSTQGHLGHDHPVRTMIASVLAGLCQGLCAHQAEENQILVSTLHGSAESLCWI